MVSVEEALSLILDLVQPVEREIVDLASAPRRILGEKVYAPRDHPPWNNAAMDGYALRWEDTSGASPKVPLSLQVMETISAGKTSNRRLVEGEAVRITTGAPLPEGANAVVRLEDVTESNQAGRIELRAEVQKNKDVRPMGEDVQKGNLVLSPGSKIRAAEIGLLALMQKKNVRVFQKPYAAILATGNELVEPWENPTHSQIINTNSDTLAAQVLISGGKPVRLGIARDGNKIEEGLPLLLEKIRSGLPSDLLIIAGGVGPGCEDRTEQALSELGAKILVRNVAIRPGHPFIFGSLDGKPIFALPGNPVAAMVSFFVLVRPALLKMSGRHVLYPPTYTARLLVNIDQRPGKQHYVRAVITSEKWGISVHPTPSQGSGVLTSMGQANGFIVLPEASKGAQIGEFVSVQFF